MVVVLLLTPVPSTGNPRRELYLLRADNNESYIAAINKGKGGGSGARQPANAHGGGVQLPQGKGGGGVQRPPDRGKGKKKGSDYQISKPLPVKKVSGIAVKSPSAAATNDGSQPLVINVSLPPGPAVTSTTAATASSATKSPAALPAVKTTPKVNSTPTTSRPASSTASTPPITANPKLPQDYNDAEEAATLAEEPVTDGKPDDSLGGADGAETEISMADSGTVLLEPNPDITPADTGEVNGTGTADSEGNAVDDSSVAKVKNPEGAVEGSDAGDAGAAAAAAADAGAADAGATDAGAADAGASDAGAADAGAPDAGAQDAGAAADTGAAADASATDAGAADASAGAESGQGSDYSDDEPEDKTEAGATDKSKDAAKDKTEGGTKDDEKDKTDTGIKGNAKDKTEAGTKDKAKDKTEVGKKDKAKAGGGKVAATSTTGPHVIQTLQNTMTTIPGARRRRQ